MSVQLLPPPNVLEEFDRITSGFSMRVHSANEEIRSLNALRDTLLPKLISGELRVQNQEPYDEALR